MSINESYLKSLQSASGAEFSKCNGYRYALWRRWDNAKPYVLFIGVNPSTADHSQNDPTVNRCISFAKRWGYGGVYMAYLFSLISTEQKIMLMHNNAIGKDNDEWIKAISLNAGQVVCAWGANGDHKNRAKQIVSLLYGIDLKCLGTTKYGHPRHPLYMRNDTALVNFSKC